MRRILAGEFQAYCRFVLAVLAGIYLEYGNSHFGKSRRYARNDGYIVVRVYLYHSLVYVLLTLVHFGNVPLDAYPAVEKVLVFHAVYNVGAVALVYGNAVALGYKADNWVSRQGVAALGEFNGAAALAVHDAVLTSCASIA